MTSFEELQIRISKAEEVIIRKKNSISLKIAQIAKKKEQLVKMGVRPEEAIQSSDVKVKNIAWRIKKLERDIHRLSSEIEEKYKEIASYSNEKEQAFLDEKARQEGYGI